MRAVLIPADVRFPLERANGVQVVKTAAALAGLGLPTTLLVRRSDPRPTAEILSLYGIEGSGLVVRRLSAFHRTGAFRAPRLAFLARAAAASLMALARGAVVFTRDLQLADLLLRARARARVVYESHAVESVLYEERGQVYGTGEAPRASKALRLRGREERVWRRAAAVVTTTAGIAKNLGEAFGPRERVAVIPNGCDLPLETPSSPAARPRVILYAGQLYPWKGVDVLVRAVAEVSGARLVILGGMEGEADTARVRRMVEDLSLGDRVEMRGLVPQSRVAEALQKARVVAVPFLETAMTRHHTSPLKAFEAMAAGAAIVATDLPSTREVLRHGETAWLVPPGDAVAMAAGLRQLLEDDALADRLGRAAFADAARYTWQARGRALAATFAELS